MHISGEENGSPLQCSCLENPRNRGTWWAVAYGVAQSRTRLSDFNFHFSLSCIGEGNGNPHQWSCLENPRNRGTWWAAIYGVAQSRRRLKWLNSSLGKTIALTRLTIIGKVMSLLFNVISSLVMTFLPRSKCLLILWLQSPSAWFWAC